MEMAEEENESVGCLFAVYFEEDKVGFASRRFFSFLSLLIYRALAILS